MSYWYSFIDWWDQNLNYQFVFLSMIIQQIINLSTIGIKAFGLVGNFKVLLLHKASKSNLKLYICIYYGSKTFSHVDNH